MDEIEWWEFDTQAEMAEQAAGDIGFVVENAIEAHGNARVAVPSGNAYDAVYRALAAKKDIDWAKVTLIPSSERLVPASHEASTSGKLDRLFGAKGATIVSLLDEDALDDYQEAGKQANERLMAVEWPLDLVWLGMGIDGHTLGMFPGPDLERALSGPRERRMIGIRPNPMPQDEPFDRVGMTAAGIATARAFMVTISGPEKREVLEAAIKDGPLSDKPIGRLLAEIDAPVDIFWSAE